MIISLPMLLGAALLVGLLGTGPSASADPPTDSVCQVLASSSGGSLGTATHVVVSGNCPKKNSGGRASAVQTKTIFCGRASQEKGGPETRWDPACGAPTQCYRLDPKTGTRTLTDAFATLTETNGRWSRPQVWCPADPAPAVTLAAIRQQAVRLLPHVGIGIAPPNAITLVNIQTVLWADTGADRTLPNAAVVGRPVQLRVHLASAEWHFGDGTSDVSSTSGKAYDERTDPCHTKQCPGYYGHTYTTTGHLTITLTMTWRAEYSLDGGNTWLAVDPAPLTGPTATQPIHVREARAVLVPNPSGR